MYIAGNHVFVPGRFAFVGSFPCHVLGRTREESKENYDRRDSREWLFKNLKLPAQHLMSWHQTCYNYGGSFDTDFPSRLNYMLSVRIAFEKRLEIPGIPPILAGCKMITVLAVEQAQYSQRMTQVLENRNLLNNGFSGTANKEKSITRAGGY